MMKAFLSLLGLLTLSLQVAQADVLVLVHGYMSSARSWDVSGVTAVLANHGWLPAGTPADVPGGLVRPALPATVDRRVYSVDLPAEAPLQLQAAHLASLLSAVRQWHPDERLVLAGHSAGGVVARLLLVNGNPYRVESLITIASPHLGTGRAAQALDVVDFNPFFCPGPGLEMLKSAFGGDDYAYLEHSRGALQDLLPEQSGNVLAWMNRQPHANIRYFSVVRYSPEGSGDNLVPAYSQDMNNVAALRGRAVLIPTPASHTLNPADGELLASILAR
jgi:pimeloyl-ACP methyl ester carboxylesterase